MTKTKKRAPEVVPLTVRLPVALHAELVAWAMEEERDAVFIVRRELGAAVLRRGAERAGAVERMRKAGA